VVDLHLHTTISDGRLTPRELVDRVWTAGVRVMSVTDHDTTLGTAEVRALATARGIEAVSGIEVTAVEDGRDIHILGYFVDEQDTALAVFLAEQRSRRLTRVREIAERLAALGMPVDVAPLLAEATQHTGRSIGRPLIAREMIRAGYVATVSDAFDKWLGQGKAAFVRREGPRCEAVIDIIHAARGLASIAHPGTTAIDSRIPALCEAGLDAIEVYHSDHDAAQVDHYSRIAQKATVLVTGGSDFHGDPQQKRAPGGRTLPEPHWLRLKAAAQAHA